MAGLFAVNGGVQIDNAVVSFGEGRDLHCGTVGDLLFQVPEQLLTDDLSHDLAFGLVSGNIVREHERTFYGVLIAFFQQGIHTVTGLCTDGDDGVKGTGLRICGNNFQKDVLLHRIDLVDGEDGRYPARHHLLDQCLLLLTYRRNRLYNKHSQIHIGDGILNGVDHVVAQLGAGLVETGGIHKDELGIVLGQDAADPVAGGLGFIGNNGDLLANQMICKCGLAHIGPSGDGYNRSSCVHNYLSFFLSSLSSPSNRSFTSSTVFLMLFASRFWT